MVLISLDRRHEADCLARSARALDSEKVRRGAVWNDVGVISVGGCE